MYNRILVPLDGSSRAEAILPHVEELARLCSAHVCLIQVIEVSVLSNVTKAEANAYEAVPKPTAAKLDADTEAAQAYLTQVAQRLRAFAPEVSSEVAVGPIASTILTSAETHNIDLIAMASHGRSGLKEKGINYGSVAEAVLHRVDRPLLIVRAD